MIANHIHDALAQVRTLQEFIIEKNLFKGYSGKARILSGFCALAGASLLSSDFIAPNPWHHLAGWTVVLIAGVMTNYAALLYWFLFDREVKRNPLMLKPAIDAIPALAVGGVLSLVLVLRHQFDMLPGTWMSLYGLAQVAYRNSLPKGIYRTGLFYIVCGAACLMSHHIQFANPWPMGLVFFAGEIAGGCILLSDHRRTAAKESAQERNAHR
jgi:hypothetical protein